MQIFIIKTKELKKENVKPLFVTDLFPGELKLPLEICEGKESNGQQGFLKKAKIWDKNASSPCCKPLTFDFNKHDQN